MRPRQAGKDGEAFEADLIRQESAGLLRVERTVEKPDARRIRMPDGQSGIDFSSNSYLGLHQRVRARAVRRFLSAGHLTSAGSSRMVSGTHPPHRRLERSLADFLRAEDAAVFGSGFLCCFGVIDTLAGSRDRIFFDERIHASLRAGIDHTRAPSFSYRHLDMDDLRRKLAARDIRGRRFIVTDGLYSMGGDFAPLDTLAELADRHGAWLIVDDAHGIGAIGASGRGTYERFGRAPEARHILIGTLSKTLASYGGFVAASSAVIRYIKARSKAFIYTTAAPPFQILAAEEALAIVRSRTGAELREKLQSNIRLLVRLLKRRPVSQIVPVPIAGGSSAVLEAAQSLWSAGCFAPGMRYPTVPRGQEMIRISLSAAHRPSDIRRLAAALGHSRP